MFFSIVLNLRNAKKLKYTTAVMQPVCAVDENLDKLETQSSWIKLPFFRWNTLLMHQDFTKHWKKRKRLMHQAFKIY